jgi:hypothetical protein
MDMFHINVTEIVTVLVTGALLMIPVLGWTLRTTLPPIIEAIGRARAERPRSADRRDNGHSARSERPADPRRAPRETTRDDFERDLAALDL